MKKKFSTLGRTKAGSPKLVIQEPKDYLNNLSEMSGSVIITIEEVNHEGSDAQIWHFENKVLPLVVSLSAKSGQVMSETEAETLLLHQICKIEISRGLRDLKMEELSTVIDFSKKWINEFFMDTEETGRTII